MNFIIKFLCSFILLFTNLDALDYSKDVIGTGCTIKEPLRNYTFNFTSLTTTLGRFVNGDEDDKIYHFNICGTIGRKCNNSNSTVSACMINKSTKKEYVIGYGEQKLFWNDGSFRFSYTGQKCNSTHNYTLTVLLMCDYDTNSHNNLGVFHHGDSCDIVSVMHTSSACLPKSETYKNTKCFLKNGAGQILNFESLRNTNHRIERPDGKEFIISICDPVLYNHESACEAGSSVCLFDSKAEGTERYKNIGTMNQDFQLNGKLVELKLKSKVKCSRTGLNYESIIIFECDKLAENGYPSFSHFNEDICQYVFQWPTAAACVEKSSCHATNPDTGLSYDFSQLSGVQFEASISNKTDKKIVFSICSEAKDPCMKNTGSCLVKTKNNQSTQAGIVNNELKIDGKNPYLLYESGAICEKIGQNYKTRIDFICADNLHDEGATVIEDGCNIVIQYRTLLACGYLKNCIAKKLNGEEIDLSPLIDFDGNYEAKVNSKTLPKEASDEIKYVLNICRPLNSFYSLNCRGTSGACRTVLDKKTGKHEKEMTLGHPEYIMTATKDDKVIMKYLDGASCEEEKDENVTTKITFYCDEKAGLGNPILQSIEFCEYSFDFATNLLCKDQLVSMVNDSSCNLVNNKNSVSIDLKLFGDNGTFIVDGDKINICGGDNKFYTIVYSHSLVRIEFAMNHGNDKIDVEVQIKCSADNSTAIVNDNRILVLHESELICPLFNIKAKPKLVTVTIPPPIDPNNAESDKITDNSQTSGFKLGYLFFIGIVIVSFVAFFMVLRNPERREIIRNLVSFRSRSTRIQYSRVRLGADSQLLNIRSAELLPDESSDDENILL